MSVRPFIPQDREIYLAFSKEFYDLPAVLHKIPHSHFERGFEEIMQGNPYINGFLILHGEKPAGYAITAPTYSVESGGMRIWLDELYIGPDFQSHGLGTEFLQYMEEFYHAKHVAYRLEVSPENASVLSYYEKLGYQSLPYIQLIKYT